MLANCTLRSTIASNFILVSILGMAVIGSSSPGISAPVSTVKPDRAIAQSQVRNSKTLPLRKSMPYPEARRRLLQQGWQPNGQTHDRPSAAVQTWIDLGYTEVEDCSGTGEGLCRFVFLNDHGDRLFVVTRGIDRTVRNWWIEPATSSTIAPGRYWVGFTGQALEVEQTRYRYVSEGGEGAWRSLSELHPVKEGVIFWEGAYWCRSTDLPEGNVAFCSEQGWGSSRTTALPFIGTRRFNFLGGTGTTYSMTIAKDGQTVIDLLGTAGRSQIYRGQFINPIPLDGGGGLLFQDERVFSLKTDGQVATGCRIADVPCASELW